MPDKSPEVLNKDTFLFDKDEPIVSVDQLGIKKERYEPISIGSNSSTVKFVDSLKANNADSSNLKTSNLKMKEEIEKHTPMLERKPKIEIKTTAYLSLNNETSQERSKLPSSGELLQNPFEVDKTLAFKFIESELDKEVHPLEAVALRMDIQVLYSDSYAIDIIDARSPSLIYAKLKSTDDNFDESISNEVMKTFSKRSELHFTFFAGMLCMVLSGQLWRRGVVTKISNKDVDVYLMDYGNVIQCKTGHLMPLLKEWKATPAQAFPMKLITVEPKTGLVEWTDEACKFLRKTLLKTNSMIKIRPEFKDKMVYGIRMKIGTRSVDKILEDGGMAQRIPCELPQVHPEWKPVNDVNHLAHYYQNLPFEICEIPWEKAVAKEFQAYVTNVVSPKKFYCRIYEKTKDLKVDQIEMELKDYFTSENTEQSEDLECGSTCAFKLNITSWRRGLILKMLDGSAVIFAIDYGFKYTIPLADVFPLPQAWKVLPAQSLYMQLQYVAPLGQNGFSQYACDRFKELTNGRLLRIRIVNCSKALYRVLMFDVKSGCNVGDKLVEEGFATHIFGQRPNQPFSGEFIIFLNIF